jgi:hypothetical protein
MLVYYDCRLSGDSGSLEVVNSEGSRAVSQQNVIESRGTWKRESLRWRGPAAMLECVAIVFPKLR